MPTNCDGITWLVRSFCLTAAGNLFLRLYKAPNNIWKIPWDPLTKFYSWPSLFSSHNKPFLVWSTDFPDCHKGSVASLCWSHPVVRRGCVQIIISNRRGNHANQYPACNYWIYCSLLRSLAFSEGDIHNYWSITRCHLKSPTLCSWEQQCYTGTVGIHWIRSHKEKIVLFVTRGKNVFSQRPGSGWFSSGKSNGVSLFSRFQDVR